MIKKVIYIILLAALIISCFAGCKSNDNIDSKGKLNIIATVFPPFDFARNVCGDDANVTQLLAPGTESHSYEPTAQDIINIGKCDLFIYGGGESDSWVDKILASIDKPIRTLKMMECVEVVEETLTQGMEGEIEEGEYDEHVWTSPLNASLIAQRICDEMVSLDPNNAQAYKNRTSAYIAQIQTLDSEFETFFASVDKKTLVFGDRFPFRYFAERYSLNYYAAFPGCAAQTEPSAATIAFLINKVKDEGMSKVFYIEFSNTQTAQTIADGAGAQIALLHSCHNVSKSELNSGVTYLKLMQQNLEVLKEAMV